MARSASTRPAIWRESLERLTRRAVDRAALEELLGRVIEAAGAERGFLFAFRSGGGLRVLAALNSAGERISEAETRLSHHAVRCMWREGKAHIALDARRDRRYRSEEAARGGRAAVSIAVFPLYASGELAGGAYVDHRFQALELEARWEDLRNWTALAAVALALFDTTRRERRLRAQIARAREATGGARSRAAALAEMPASGKLESREFHGLLSANPQMLRIFEVIDSLRGSSIPVLILGETGTGKSALARAVHAASERREGPFVAVAPQELPEPLLEAELLGYRRGAFTGADRDHTGLVEQAHGGTLFLDGVSSMPPGLQTKLLRILEEGRVRPLGAASPVRADIRIVSSAGGDLRREVETGRLRRDLFYRLKGCVLELPPLRERPEDIPLLVKRLQPRGSSMRFSKDAWRALTAYEWPGNVRELANEIERLRALGIEEVSLDDLAPEIARAYSEEGAGGSGMLEARLLRAEEEAILTALRRAGGNKAQAARILGITRKALYRRLEKFGLHRRKGEGLERRGSGEAQ